MRVSYGQLIREHDAIDTAAAALLADLVDGRASSTELANDLQVLADTVEAHIEVEDGIVGGMDSNRLTGPWAAAWQEGQQAFEQLRSDWVVFLNRWDAASVDADRTSFADETREILGRLRERVQQETRAFYATALQTGAIELR